MYDDVAIPDEVPWRERKHRFYQCTLNKQYAANVNWLMVSWLPEKFAVKGTTLKLRMTDGQWLDGWVVTRVGAMMLKSDVDLLSRDYKRTRRASDVPKGTFKR